MSLRVKSTVELTLFSGVYVSALMYTVRSTQEMHTGDCVLTGMGGHGCGRKSRLADTGVGWSSSKHATDTWSAY